MPDQPQLPLGAVSSAQFGAVPEAREGAARSSGYRPPNAQLQVAPQVGFAIQQEYRRRQGLPTNRRIEQSYGAARDEINRQHEMMTRPQEQGGLGIRHEVTERDPYKSPADLAADVTKNRRLKTFSAASTGGHEFFTNQELDKFRAVHDFFGHLALSRGFSRHGEEAAWQGHRQMFPQRAQEAVASELRGQNSYFNYGREHDFPDQGPGSNLVTMPKWAQSAQAASILKERDKAAERVSRRAGGPPPPGSQPQLPLRGLRRPQLP